MKLPEKMPACPSRAHAAPGAHQPDTRLEIAANVSLQKGPGEGLTPAGCCVEVCLPVVGCHCQVSSPFC